MLAAYDLSDLKNSYVYLSSTGSGGILLRVIVITQGISNILESILESGHEVIGIVESSPSREPSSLLKTLRRFLTSLYYLFTQNPLNLRLFPKKSEYLIIILKKEITRVWRNG